MGGFSYNMFIFIVSHFQSALTLRWVFSGLFVLKLDLAQRKPV